MAPNIPDRYLWLGLGLFTLLAIPHVASRLRTLRALTRITHPPPLPPQARLTPESSLTTSALLTLATSHNIDIRASATKLLCTRFYASPSARALLLRNLASQNKGVRRRAQLASRVLLEAGVVGEYGVFREFGAGYGILEARGWDGEGALARGTGEEEEEEDERDVRRRRREAVVIHEGEGTVGEGDVWMRNREGAMVLDVEAGELVIDGVAH